MNLTPVSVALVSLIALASAGEASAACQFQKIADVPVTMEGLRPTIMAKINGQDAKFLVDTGAFFSGVTTDTAGKYGLKHSIAPFGRKLQGVGGVSRDMQAVAAESFVFAGMGFRNADFVVIGRVGGDLVGNIGENLMGPFDVEYDLANGVMRYFKATGCGYDTNLAYWSAGLPVSRLSIIEPTTILTRVITTAKVDDHSIRVMFDSGSSLSAMSRTAAGRAGIKVTSDGVVSGGISYGIFGKGLETFLAPFASFKIGEEEIKNTRLRVADIELPGGDMLLGADFFLSHRILISNSQKKVYFTYNGGPVFRLDQVGRVQAQAAPAAGGSEPKTGAEFARRAAGLAARRDYLPAIADYTRAIALEPDVARNYRARATARLAVRQTLPALDDLNEALKRDPSDSEALMLRGRVALAMGEPVKAKVDFDMAIKLAPADPDLMASIGVVYAQAGLYEPAIHALDGWIVSHPKSEDMAQVLNARCYTRGVWGRELDLALADCDAALKKDRVSAIMDSRALVLLRMGRLDEAIAQYGAAIKAQPGGADSLYGRGLAELKKGQKAEGEADMAAAKAISPGIDKQFQKFGLAPDGPPPAAKS